MKNLYIFDFDWTLFLTPTPEQKNIWENKLWKAWPHRGWWGRQESLDIDIFEILPHQQVKKAFEKAKSDKDWKLVLMTGRRWFLEKDVKKILEKENFEFDEIYFNNFWSTESFKMKQIEILLRKWKYENIFMWEDRDDHYPIFKDFWKKLVLENKVKNFVIYKITWDKILENF